METSSKANFSKLNVLRWLQKVWFSIQAPVIAIVGGLLIGALIMVITGHNPIEAYSEMLEGSIGGRNSANLVSTINRAAPIIGMGIAASIAFRAGAFNIGGEGQLVLGGVAAALTAVYVPLPPLLLVPLSLLAAALVGGLYAMMAAFFEYRFNVPLLVSTLLLNYPARYFSSYLVTHPFRDVVSGMNQTFQVPENVRFALLGEHTQLHAGLFITLTIVILAAFIINRTVPGYEVRMTGLNARFSLYGGIRAKKIGYWSMFLSGAVAGIVGAIEILGVVYRYVDGALTLPLYAWTGIMTALLSGSSPFGVLAAGLFFSAVQTGGFGMERKTDVVRELSRVLQAIIIMLVAARASFQFGKQKDIVEDES
ncbi:MAG: ABC transporter permease [Anaerolineales bacterium]|nr:ABC transporter permease [Anaerolineales bacterium]